MKQPKSWAELYQQFEDDEIDRAIATLERIRLEQKSRKNGDFTDFLLSHKDEVQSSDNIESQLANVDVGETL